ncbi:hypothetical protein B9Z19DRAFT_1097428 [Tuber borchii]|uniref:Uncharacterized protein n=1 Tax=Tuber borchii TaxID=42251 RepID=A0A2T6ZAA0_TUBBO|nr:hypothetical protein B9Z19DRAFT_1097428 [Tuber borchii]
MILVEVWYCSIAFLHLNNGHSGCCKCCKRTDGHSCLCSCLLFLRHRPVVAVAKRVPVLGAEPRVFLVQASPRC